MVNGVYYLQMSLPETLLAPFIQLVDVRVQRILVQFVNLKANLIFHYVLQVFL